MRYSWDEANNAELLDYDSDSESCSGEEDNKYLVSITEKLIENMEQLSSMLDNIEATHEKEDNKKGLRVLQKRVVGPSINFLAPGRKLLKFGRLNQVDSPQAKPKPRRVALCNDIIVIMKEKKMSMIRRNLEITQVLKLESAQISVISVCGLKHTFMIHTMNDVKIFSAESKYDLKEWMEKASKCIEGDYNVEVTNQITNALELKTSSSSTEYTMGTVTFDSTTDDKSDSISENSAKESSSVETQYEANKSVEIEIKTG